MSTPQNDVAAAMRAAGDALLSALTGDQRVRAVHAFADATRTRWSYMPSPRPGVGLLGLGSAARKAVHRLLATALSRPAFAQAVTIMALEEVLDLDEHGRRGRHSDDYWVALFGTPGDEVWSWRFEGHHVSVTATLLGDEVVVAPLFLGANPARVHADGHLVLGPLEREEELARALLAALPARLRERAVVSGTAPADLLTSTHAGVQRPLEPPGVRAADLSADDRGLLGRLVTVYLDRLAPALAEAEHRRLRLDEATFAWAGGPRAGQGHYYRVQAPGLLIEYDNTQHDANHAHTVLRRPHADFGGDLLTAHLAAER